jgi:hypothetical protein
LQRYAELHAFRLQHVVEAPRGLAPARGCLRTLVEFLIQDVRFSLGALVNGRQQFLWRRTKDDDRSALLDDSLSVREEQFNGAADALIRIAVREDRVNFLLANRRTPSIVEDQRRLKTRIRGKSREMGP